MAHLSVHPDATHLWEIAFSHVSANNRPAYLEQTDGVGHQKIQAGNLLLNLAEKIKENLDLSRFNAAYCGFEAAELLKEFNPAAAQFASAQDLFTVQTTYANKHDTLITNLDRSGSYDVEESYSRRIDCFENFVGQPGRSKDMALFYCFLLWEGRSFRWTTRKLGGSIGRDSLHRSRTADADDDDGYDEQTLIINCCCCRCCCRRRN